jgi:UDP-3-O-acyl N-acetylglucosamine deacetylase
VHRHTLDHEVRVSGIGVHTGVAVEVLLGPAPAGTGILFRRTDLPDAHHVPARLEFVGETDRRTQLRRGDAGVDTVEHLLAVLLAAEIDDLQVDVSGPELPILDGSFAPWLEAVQNAGVVAVSGDLREYRVKEGFAVQEGNARYRVEPHPALEIRAICEFEHPVIGRQEAVLTLTAGNFRREVAGARTFGFAEEVAALQRRGLLLGASPGCAVVLTERGLLDGELRWPNEFARHKLGDLVGDLMLLGGRVKARIDAERPSHRGNVALARAIAERTQPGGSR